MRRTLLSGALLLALPAAAGAQDVQLSGFAGWRFGGSGRDPITAQEIDIAGAASFGGTAALAVAEKSRVELYFSRAETEAQPLFTPATSDLAVSYLHLGFLYDLGEDATAPFVGVALGGTRLVESGEARTRFSLSAVLGVRHMVTPHLGLRADGRLLLTLDEAGGRSGRDSTGVAAFEYRAYTIAQAELTAGVVLAF